jgi:adenosylhomocysteine nucleosidase
MTRVAIIAAMPGELNPLARGWERERRNGVELRRRRRGESEWVAACAGAGVDAAARAFAEIEREGAVDRVFSVGWAGALREEFAAGRAYRVSGIVDARTGERFRAAGPAGECWLVTHDRVADRAEKRRLAATHGAGLVDMEAAGVARLAAARGLPLHCVKGVSDGPEEPLADFNRFISGGGKFRLMPFMCYAVLRPGHWPSLMRMGRNSRRAAQEIGGCVADILSGRPGNL